MAYNKKTKYNKIIKLVFTAGSVILLIIGITLVTLDKEDKQQDNNTSNVALEAQTSKNGDLIIPVSNVSEKATFYEYEVDDTTLEVLAIKAADGSIRTAFNTCQVCYSSGRGYYEQEGDLLVCQNCGNQFQASDVEVTKGGCNPVPIFSDSKTVDETNITISKEYLESAKEIFENWKS